MRFGVLCDVLLAFTVPICASVPEQAPLASSTPNLPAALSKELLSLHKGLVEIESISENEYEVGNWLASYLISHGFTVEKQKLADKRYNVMAWPKGVEKGTEDVLVTSHIDTVPPFIPYKHHNDGTISGRGSVDAKASVAAQIIATLDILDSYDLANAASGPPLALLYVIDEEKGGGGMRFFSTSSLNKKNYSTVIFGEPTEGNLASGHKGNTLLEVIATGKAAHSGYPWLGISANDILIEALSILKYLESHPGSLPSSDKYGNTTINVGALQGGVADNVVAASARAGVALRLAGGTPAKVVATLQQAIQAVKDKAQESGGDIDIIKSNPGYPPVDLSCDVEGLECITVNYGTDVPNLEVSDDTKRYLYGPGSILVAHGANEAIKVEELERAVGDYKKLITLALEGAGEDKQELKH